MGRFHVHDCAKLARPRTLLHLKGEEVVIVEEEKERRIVDTDTVVRAYAIRLLKTGERFIAEDKQLDPLDDPNTPSNWKECLWRPKETME